MHLVIGRPTRTALDDVGRHRYSGSAYLGLQPETFFDGKSRSGSVHGKHEFVSEREHSKLGVIAAHVLPEVRSLEPEALDEKGETRV